MKDDVCGDFRPAGEELTSTAHMDAAGTYEQRRIAALHASGLLDTAREREFDEIIELASAICHTPMCSFTLVDATRQWFKASVGIGVSETSRELSFCSHAIQQKDMFVVEDTHEDARFVSHPAVQGEHGVRFYAGVPLAGPGGYMMGTLCVADVVPRQLTAAQVTALEVLASQLLTRIDLRVQQERLEKALLAQEQLVAALRSTDERFRTFMNHAPFLGYIKDQEGRFLFYNRKMADQFRVDTEAWLGRTISEIWPGPMSEVYRENDQRALCSPDEVVYEEETVGEDGRTTFWRSYKFPCFDEKGERLIGGISVDVTDEVVQRRALEHANSDLEEHAHIDALTGLANRRSLDARMEVEFQMAKRHGVPFSIVMLDVDDFKKRNDTYGHAAGDEVLRRLGELIRMMVRTTDLAGRFGGEEMLLLLPGTDADGAMFLAERIRTALHDERWAQGCVTASFGTASVGAEMRHAKALLACADQAMYAAKRSGKDVVVQHKRGNRKPAARRPHRAA